MENPLRVRPLKRLTRIATFFLSLTFQTFADEPDNDKAELIETAKNHYTACAACHGQDGQGVAASPSKMAPSLTNSQLVNGDPSVLALLILKGIAKENRDYLGIMAPLEAVFPTDEKLAAILNYVRNSFGNSAGVVSVEDAAKYREQWKNEKVPVPRQKLVELLK